MAGSAGLIDMVRAAALNAGTTILEIYAQPFAVQQKADASPVTLADQLAEAAIVEALRKATPDIPIIAEELTAAGHLPAAAPARFWLVDPLDGTKEFIARNGEFTVNIALIENGLPILGVVHAPAQGVTYWADAGVAKRQRGREAPQALAARAVPPAGAIVVHSRSHGDDKRLDRYVAALPQAERRLSGSSIKFCLIAAGEADLYPRFGRTMEWDTAAGQAVLHAAGGSVATLAGAPLRYGKRGFENPDFVAQGK